MDIMLGFVDILLVIKFHFIVLYFEAFFPALIHRIWKIDSHYALSKNSNAMDQREKKIFFGW
jgi:hypothetical protein